MVEDARETISGKHEMPGAQVVGEEQTIAKHGPGLMIPASI